MIRSFNFFEADPRLRSSAAVREDLLAAARPYMGAAAVAVAVVVAMCGVAYSDERNAETEYNAVGNTAAGMQDSVAAPGQAAASSAVLSQVVTDGTLADSYRASGPRAAVTYSEVAAAVPRHVWLTMFSYDAATVKLTGTLREPSLFDGMQIALGKLDTVVNPFPESIAPADTAPQPTRPPFAIAQNVGMPPTVLTPPTVAPGPRPVAHLATFAITLTRVSQVK